jgi:signal transduction histidine kinase
MEQARAEITPCDTRPRGIALLHTLVFIRTIMPSSIALDVFIAGAIAGALLAIAAAVVFRARDAAREADARRVIAAAHGLDTLAAIGGIAARVAHEINNPLAGIHYSFLLIKDAVPADHPQYSSVAAIEREIARIAAVTRQLCETYRPEKDVQADASLATIVVDAAAFLEQSNQSSRVRVVTDLVGAPSVVSLSAAVLRQIVYNLVQHAIDASPPDGTVLVAARVDDDVLELRVAANEQRTASNGIGLGLALVRQTVTATGGAIRVAMTASGGSEFIATLPLATREVRP